MNVYYKVINAVVTWPDTQQACFSAKSDQSDYVLRYCHISYFCAYTEHAPILVINQLDAQNLVF